MDKANKSPLLAGLMNVLVPGSSQLYINSDWGKFLRAFVIGAAAFTAAYLSGNTVQTTRGYDLPQGLCTGGLMMAIAALYFVLGFKVARERNSETDAAAFYNSKRNASHAASKTKYTKTRKMRDEGLISDQEYDAENAKPATRTK